METFTPAFIRKFHNLYDRGPGCWLWFGGTDRDGYGVIMFGRKTLTAHRVSYALVHGQIPPGMLVMHSCDVPRCVNPAHLSLGTIKDNNRDMTRKGRLKRPAPEFLPRGSRSAQAKLTALQVLKIRSRVMAGESQSKLAAEFGVSQATVNKIILRETWKHI
jgi:hypothetical protein